MIQNTYLLYRGSSLFNGEEISVVITGTGKQAQLSSPGSCPALRSPQRRLNRGQTHLYAEAARYGEAPATSIW